jgi:hypothetical protein
MLAYTMRAVVASMLLVACGVDSGKSNALVTFICLLSPAMTATVEVFAAGNLLQRMKWWEQRRTSIMVMQHAARGADMPWCNRLLQHHSDYFGWNLPLHPRLLW